MIKLQRIYLDVARNAGMADPVMVGGGRHSKIVGYVGSKQIRLAVGLSKPANQRSILNAVAFIRRQIRRAQCGEV